MYIHEAIQNISEEQPYITREKWISKELDECLVVILPTDSPDHCILDGYAARRPSRGWQPSAEDLTANDWRTVPDVVVRHRWE